MLLLLLFKRQEHPLLEFLADPDPVVPDHISMRSSPAVINDRSLQCHMAALGSVLDAVGQHIQEDPLHMGLVHHHKTVL